MLGKKFKKSAHIDFIEDGFEPAIPKPNGPTPNLSGHATEMDIMLQFGVFK